MVSRPCRGGTRRDDHVGIGIVERCDEVVNRVWQMLRREGAATGP
jgi:hypothetical protein